MKRNVDLEKQLYDATMCMNVGGTRNLIILAYEEINRLWKFIDSLDGEMALGNKSLKVLGSMGGKARKEKLSPDRRKEIAQKAARASAVVRGRNKQLISSTIEKQQG